MLSHAAKGRHLPKTHRALKNNHNPNTATQRIIIPQRPPNTAAVLCKNPLRSPRPTTFVPVDHYENFPVASLLMPKRLREPVEVIYRFARAADDIADEGDAPASTRLQQLRVYTEALNDIAQGNPPIDAQFVELARVIALWSLPLQPLHDLLNAFSQDVVKTRYANFAELLDYARRSANPVGRLMLHLFDMASAPHLAQSDAICTGLQLINFWQDVAVDWKKNRIYLPQDAMQRFGVTEQHIAQGLCDDAWRALLANEVERASAMLKFGAPLGHSLPGRVGLEIRMTVQGGLRIAEKLQAVQYDMFRHRPTLRWYDWPLLLLRAR